MRYLRVLVAAGAIGMMVAGLLGCGSYSHCGGPPIYVPAEPVEVPQTAAPTGLQHDEDRP